MISSTKVFSSNEYSYPLVGWLGLYGTLSKGGSSHARSSFKVVRKVYFQLESNNCSVEKWQGCVGFRRWLHTKSISANGRSPQLRNGWRRVISLISMPLPLNITKHRASTSTDISRSALCCHSSEIRALITNPPNSVQLQCTAYHSPNLHPGPCSSVGMRRGSQTHRRPSPICISPQLRRTRNVTTSVIITVNQLCWL